MPNKASENTKSTILTGIENVVDELFNNADTMEPDLLEWSTKVRNEEAEKSFNPVFDKVMDFNYVGSRNKNYQLQQETKEAFQNIINYMQSERAAGGEIDYDEWNEKVTQALPVFMEKLDAFNEATDYDYINSPEMRCLNKMINRINDADITVRNCEYSEPLAGIQKSAKGLEEDLKDLEGQAKEFYNFCKEKKITPDTMDKENRAFLEIEEDIDVILENGEEEIAGLKAEREELNKKQQFEQVYKETAVFLVEKKLAESKRNDLQEQLLQVENKQLLDWYERPEGLENATKSLAQLTDFQREHDTTSPSYVEDFLKADPENKEDILSDTEFKAYQDKINQMAPEQLAKYIADASAEHTKTIREFDTPEHKKFIDTFFKTEELKQKMFAQKQKELLADGNINKGTKKLTEVNQTLKEPENVNARLKKTWDKLQKLSTAELRDARYSMRESAEKKMKPTAKMKAVDESIEAQQELLDFCKKNKDGMIMDSLNVDKANSMRKKVVTAQTAFNAKRESYRQQSDIVNPDTRVKDSTQAYLNRFANQINKCTRLGHTNSDAFTNMETALKAAQENATPENLKAMKTAADAYLEARKNDRSLFSTKMRRHRLDLAKSISDFGASCEMMDFTLESAAATKKAAQSTIDKSTPEVLVTQKNTTGSLVGSKLKNKVGKYLHLTDKVKKSSKVLDEIKEKEIAKKELAKKELAKKEPAKKNEIKKQVEKAEPAANMI